jgi:integrase
MVCQGLNIGFPAVPQHSRNGGHLRPVIRNVGFRDAFSENASRVNAANRVLWGRVRKRTIDHGLNTLLIDLLPHGLLLTLIRKLVSEAKRNKMIGLEEAANLTDVPNVRQKGTRLGNWLTREQAKELLAVPDRSKLKGKRDYVILALLVGCALRRQELASLKIEDIQLREGRWVIIDLRGRGGRIRTVAVPIWVKQGIDAWITAAKIEKGRLLSPLSKSGKMVGEELGDWAIWSVVEQSSKQIGIEHFGAHDLRRTCAKLCRKNGGDLEPIKFLLGHSSLQTTERYLGSEQEIAVAAKDNLGL